MEIPNFDELPDIDNQTIAKDNPDSWLWPEDPFKLDSESHIEIAKSFWDDLTQNDEEIFASTPPIVDERESSPSYFAECSQESESTSPTSYAAENCGRIKRRRMLHFSGTGEECVPAASPAFESGSANDSTFVSSIVSDTDKFLMPVPSSPSNIWYSKDVVSEEAGNPEEAVKGTDNKWLSKCLEDKEPHSPPEQSKIVVRSVNRSEASGLSTQSSPSPSSEGEVLQGPLTPFSKGSTPGWRPSPLTRFRVKATPVAYPFNLLKPNSAHGDVTLSDINQRIKSPSPRPTRRLPSKEEQNSPSQSASGLSGKAVVACTKIHTEGNGTITIMRTRG
ncbi:hypothetical protein KC19_3G022200 [Ceratodon purpureus]|uniref:Protein XRI1 n=1 Tax=Ceratodon purpureus TaxID=3225 RepID=A0A8T0IGD8_CERPU|nr:hypothetical protein KC19_3G022200 [Ceratodon purpureus]